MKQFTYAGVSRLKGELKLRFTTSDTRFMHLLKVGHTEIEMIKLTKPLTKDEAIKELLVRNFDNGRTEITNLLVGKARGATVKKNTVVIKVPPKAIQQLVGKQIEVSEAMTAAQARKVRDAWNKAHSHLSYDGE
jgi:plasmid maintenance system antidote protein VapI